MPFLTGITNSGLQFFRGLAVAGIRALFGGGRDDSSVIDYVNVDSAGNATDFGDLTVARYHLASVSSSTRGVFGGGYTGSADSNVLDYVTIASASNATDFGDLTVSRFGLAAGSNETTGLFGGGNALNVIDSITIASTGNATDFADLTQSKNQLTACASPTHVFFLGGIVSSTRQNVIEHIVIDSSGNAYDFGDLTEAVSWPAAAANATRGLRFGGYNNALSPIVRDTIDYITLSSTGNALDFGDLTVGRERPAASSSSTLSVVGGGKDGTSSYVNIVDSVEIATLGNAVDFGDLTVARSDLGATSDGHGGLFVVEITAAGTARITVSGGGRTNTIRYIDAPTFGDHEDFGDLTAARGGGAGASSTTRALQMGGTQTTNVIDYWTFATLGNAADFGNLTTSSSNACAGTSSNTRGLRFGGAQTNTIDYVTIATLGNATDFGDSSLNAWFGGACASATRAVYAPALTGNYPNFTPKHNVLEYVTIASVGNATDFGDLLSAAYPIQAAANPTRGIFERNQKSLDYITIASTGNSQAFGTLGLSLGSQYCQMSGSQTEMTAYAPLGSWYYRVQFASQGNGVVAGTKFNDGNELSSQSTNHGGMG